MHCPEKSGQVGFLLFMVAALSAISLFFLQWAGTFRICESQLFNTVNQTVVPSLNLLGYSGWLVLLTFAA